MSKTSMNLQDSFLNQVRRENSEVKVLLVNGTTLRGTVKGFDNFTLILSSRNGQHLVYKHAIAQLLSHRSAPVRHDEGEAGAPTTESPEESHEETSSSTAPAVAEQAAAAPAPPRPRPSGNTHGQQQKQARDKRPPRKEGFNTLDLSLVKLEEGDKANQPS